MAWVVEGLLAACLVIVGYGTCWVVAVRPLRRALAVRDATGSGRWQRGARDRVEAAQARLPDSDGLPRAAGLLRPQELAVTGEAAAPDDPSPHGPPLVGPGMVYFERRQAFIVPGEAGGAERTFQVAVVRDLVPQPVHCKDPEAVTELVREDSDFGDRLAGVAADYFVGEYGDPLVTRASPQVWLTSQSFPETALAGLCDQVSDWLTRTVEGPLTQAERTLDIPAPLAPAGAATAAALILQPVTRPLGECARFCEIVGVGIGLLAGCHPLVLASAKLLAKREIHDLMTRGAVGALKMVLRDELPARTERGDRRAGAELSTQRESQVSREAGSTRRPPGSEHSGRLRPTSGWDGSRTVGREDGRPARPDGHLIDSPATRPIRDGRPSRPGAGWREWNGSGDDPSVDARDPTRSRREPHRRARGRPGADGGREDPGTVGEPNRDETEQGRDVRHDRDGNGWSRGGRT